MSMDETDGPAKHFSAAHPRCPVCRGAGWHAATVECRACGGSGVRREDDPDDFDAEDCPWCGEGASKEEAGEGEWSVGCAANCKASLDYAGSGTLDEACCEWNRNARNYLEREPDPAFEAAAESRVDRATRGEAGR